MMAFSFFILLEMKKLDPRIAHNIHLLYKKILIIAMLHAFSDS